MNTVNLGIVDLPTELVVGTKSEGRKYLEATLGDDVSAEKYILETLDDAEDYCHIGFEAFLPFIEKWQPRYLIHGHVHMNYGHDIQRVLQYGNTKIINACERYTLEF